jgi:hypothetical protein
MMCRSCAAAKADRLKQAKQEAEREIKAYKSQREEQYQKRISDVREDALSQRGKCPEDV